ncbi:MAG: hypothetical protein Q7S74_00775 [Nanoarchaeota archaeon]|nr:hypothetical protein [Nanoarchaeota archaeon]
MKTKKLFLFLAFSLVLSVIFIEGVLAASTIFDPVKSMFSDWQQGNLSINVAKYLFLILLTLIIFAVLGLISLFENLHTSLRFVIALIIGFLATAYLTPSDVYTTLASYGALGIVLSAVIPLVILVFFSMEIYKNGGVGGILLSKVMWGAFVVFLIWKLIDGIFGVTGGVKIIGQWEGWIYIGFIILAVLWILGLDRRILAYARREEQNTVKSRYQEAVHLSTLKTYTDAAAVDSFASKKKRRSDWKGGI